MGKVRGDKSRTATGKPGWDNYEHSRHIEPGNDWPKQWEEVGFPMSKTVPNVIAPWATEETSMERLLIGWVIQTIFRDRHLDYSTLAKFAGVSKSRIAQLVNEIEVSNNYERLEALITAWTEDQGGVYAAAREADEVGCYKNHFEWLHRS